MEEKTGTGVKRGEKEKGREMWIQSRNLKKQQERPLAKRNGGKVGRETQKGRRYEGKGAEIK